MFDSETTLLLSLAVLAFLAALSGPVAFVLALVQRGRLMRLEARLTELERRPRAAPSPSPAPSPSSPSPAAIPEVPARPVGPVTDAWTAPPPPPAAPVAAVPPPPSGIAARVIPEPAPKAKAARPSFEERFGTRWTVWVGGLALALGAVLLVRYSVERGFFGPAARIGLGVLLAFALLAGGEALRRRLRGTDPAPGLRPDIPAMVTAAGTVALFGTLYAAHALYGFLGPSLAFIGLGATGLAAMAAALLHGPALAGIGLVGAMGAPLLIGGGRSGAWPLALYLPVVAGFAYAFAWNRGWRALALAAALAAAVWSLLLGRAAGTGAALFHVTAEAGLAALVFAVLPGRGRPDEEGAPQRLASGALAAGAAVTLLVLRENAWGGVGAGWIVAALAGIAIPAAAAFLSAPACAGLPVAGALLAGAMIVWPAPDGSVGMTENLLRDAGNAGALIAVALVASLGVAGAGALRLLGGSRLPPAAVLIHAAGAALTPLAALALAYLRLAHGEVAPGFAAAAGALALGFVWLAGLFRRQGEATPSPALLLGTGAFASAAVAALALGLVFGLAGGSLTLAMALAALGTAGVARRLDIPALRWCVAGLGIVVAARLAWDPTVVGPDLSRTPILNGLLLGYGLPALAFGLSARLIRLPGRAPDAPVLVAQTLALVLTALLVFFEIRHAANDGDILAGETGLLEQGLMTLSSLGFAAVLVRLDGVHGSAVIRIGSLAFGALAMLQGLAGLALVANPWLTDEPVAGGLLVNGIVAAYGLPALAALGLARLARPTRPLWYVRGAAGLGLLLGLLGLTLAIRHGFQGPRIGLDRTTSQGEWYAYSAAWLGLGLVMLAYGVLRGSRTARLASAGLVGLATVKVFLFDLAGLEGPLRALSFLGLGAALIGIGLVYQRLVFAPAPPPPAPPS
ncbi:DUF2339 domain-containing protein [Methylobacterium sp. sgz302541]|uniref:DUF2339 domain-containing protein n=1 Tax=unclassified Methylobacterium TaxID=2615210 RepID=UPI003D34EF6F